jgi:HPt (histidine-containing phosphotransfer) domain-containing protein
MPSTTLAADPSPVDFDHLTRMTLGESSLEREVLEMFVKQAARLLAALVDRSAEAAALAHTLKGSARAIGAFGVADCASALEDAARQGDDGVPELAALQAALAKARTAIETRLAGA